MLISENRMVMCILFLASQKIAARGGEDCESWKET